MATKSSVRKSTFTAAAREHSSDDEAEIAQTKVRQRRALRETLDALQTSAGGHTQDVKERRQFFHPRDLMTKGWTGREIRYVLLAVKYREPLNFTFETWRSSAEDVHAMMNGPGVWRSWPRKTLSLFLRNWSRRSSERLWMPAYRTFEPPWVRCLNWWRSNRLIDADELTPGQARSLLAWRDRYESVLAVSS